MKKIIGAVALVTLLLVGCGDSTGEVKADLPEGYMLVTLDEIQDKEISVIQHRDTGCYYTITQGYYIDSGVSMTQMYVERNGVSVPYCELFNK